MNEIVFYRELREAVSAYYRGSRPPFTLMAISIDRYKELLASAGHLAVDDLLRRIGEKISAVTDEHCRSARIVDGLFNIMFPERIDTRHRILAQKLIDDVREEEGRTMGIETTLSLAIVEYSENTHTKMERKFISHAYRAMYRVQSAGGNALSFAPEP